MSYNIFDPNLSVVELKYLLESGVNFNVQPYYGEIPLMHNYNILEKVKLLVEAGADVSGYILFEKRLPEPVFKYLLEIGVNFNVQNHYGETPLMHNYKSVEKVQLLVEAGADVNARDIYYRNILYRPLSAEVLEYLIENGADVNISDFYSETPLMYNYKSLEKVKLLVEAGADVNALDVYGRNILFRPLSAEVLEYLIENGADIGITDKQGETPLSHHYNSLEKVKILVEAGIDLNNDNVLLEEDLPTPVLKYLIEAGISINGSNFNKPLMSHIHSLEKFKLFIEAGANFKEEILLEHLPDDIFEYLIQKGANVNRAYFFLNSPLFVHRDNLNKVKLLVEAGADVNDNILHKELPDEVFEYLIAAGADVNKRYKGETLLMHYRDNPERVKLLVEAGAMY